MLLPWMGNQVIAAVAAQAQDISLRSLSSDCYSDPYHLCVLADVGLKLTLGAIAVIAIIHLARNALQRRIAEQRSTDGLGHAPARFRARPSRRRS